MYARGDYTYNEVHNPPAEYGSWSLNDGINGIITMRPTNERYATSDVAAG
jgi:hypothetical protein